MPSCGARPGRGITADNRGRRLDDPLWSDHRRDGRHSLVREDAGFKPLEIGAPMDVLWFRLSRKGDDPQETFGRIEAGQNADPHQSRRTLQCGYVIPKGSAELLKAQGLEKFRENIAALAPYVCR